VWHLFFAKPGMRLLLFFVTACTSVLGITALVLLEQQQETGFINYQPFIVYMNAPLTLVSNIFTVPCYSTNSFSIIVIRM